MSIENIKHAAFRIIVRFITMIECVLTDNKSKYILTRWVKLCDLNFDIVYIPVEYKFIKVLNQS